MKKAILSILMVLIMTIPVVSASEAVKGKHGWFGVEYDRKYNATTDTPNIVTIINRSELNFSLNSKNIIVQRKTDTWGWYSPISDVSSSEAYYYVDVIGNNYRLVTHWKNSANSSDIRITVYPDTMWGHAQKFCASVVCGIKSTIINIVNWKVK